MASLIPMCVLTDTIIADTIIARWHSSLAIQKCPLERTLVQEGSFSGKLAGADGAQVVNFCLDGADTNLRSVWYTRGNDNKRREEDLFWERESHEPPLIIQSKKSNVA